MLLASGDRPRHRRLRGPAPRPGSRRRHPRLLLLGAHGSTHPLAGADHMRHRIGPTESRQLRLQEPLLGRHHRRALLPWPRCLLLEQAVRDHQPARHCNRRHGGSSRSASLSVHLVRPPLRVRAQKRLAHDCCEPRGPQLPPGFPPPAAADTEHVRHSAVPVAQPTVLPRPEGRHSKPAAARSCSTPRYSS